MARGEHVRGHRAGRDWRLCLVDGRGLRPHAASRWATGVAVAAAGGGAELRLRVVIRNPFPAMAAQCARAAGGCCLAQTLRLHAL